MHRKSDILKRPTSHRLGILTFQGYFGHWNLNIRIQDLKIPSSDSRDFVGILKFQGHFGHSKVTLVIPSSLWSFELWMITFHMYRSLLTIFLHTITLDISPAPKSNDILMRPLQIKGHFGHFICKMISFHMYRSLLTISVCKFVRE